MAEGTIYIDEATNIEHIQKIEIILNSLEGVKRVLIDPDDGEVKIEFEEKIVSKEQILKALQYNGYRV